MKEIPLTQGYVAWVDDEDYDLVSQYLWHAHNTSSGVIYARSRMGGTQPRTFLHNFLMGAVGVDHIDGNTLNNCRSNLRPATHLQNSRNKKKYRRGWVVSSNFKGVEKIGRHRWKAQIKVNGQKMLLGKFEDEIQAAKAYDEAAMQHFGEFARINFPTQSGLNG